MTESVESNALLEKASNQEISLSPWHALDQQEVLVKLKTTSQAGLSQQEAAKRLIEAGPNQIAPERKVTFLTVAREEITEPMILLLLAVGVIYAFSGELGDALAIFFIIAGIVFVEIYNEYRAKAAIASLQRMAAPLAFVIRDGSERELAARELVPGDIVIVGPGHRVPADLRLLETIGLRIDESALTGESSSVNKRTTAVSADTELGDRNDMAYAGTLVTGGKGRGVVVATGMSAEVGRIAALTKGAREPRTPLQVSMRQLSGWLVWVALGFSVLVPALGFLFGQPLRDMILTGLTLAFATIPEELPILITVVLGLGALRLSRRQAIVKRLRAAETLGSVSVIASDKTGTITENRMVLKELWLPGRTAGISVQDGAEIESGRMLLQLGVLANDAVINHDGAEASFVGDPTDTCFLVAAAAVGIDTVATRGAGPVAEFTFDELRKLISAVYRQGGSYLVAAKGAPEAILARCDRRQIGDQETELSDEDRLAVLDNVEKMAERGLRVLALAFRRMSGETEVSSLATAGEFEVNLVFVGLVGLLDPPRAEIPAALAELKGAGIRVVMLTGDHAATAGAIAAQIGINNGRVLLGRDVEAMSDDQLRRAVAEVSVYARISPEHKLRIVRALQSQGKIVAVTGDGVNDAPALKEAAIGVAMGQTGTDVAKEAADMVLGDDSFATIVIAVEEGRKLFENLRKAVRYYLAAKFALVSSSLVAVLLHLPVPFSPIQIIVTELFMDLGASVSFTTEPAEGDVMAHSPRDPGHPFMDKGMQVGIAAGGLTLFSAVIATYLWSFSRGADSVHAQTVAFATWMFGHVVLALHMRTERQPLLLAGVFSNRFLIVWGIAAVIVLALSVNLPVLNFAIKVTPLSVDEWLVALVTPLVTTAGWEIWKLLNWRKSSPET